MNLNILFGIIPARHRRLVYALAALVIWGYGIWQASNGDWSTFWGSIATSIAPLLAASNTVAVGAEAEPDPTADEDPEDDAAAPGSGAVADVLDPDYPEHDEDAVDAEYPNSETLYQPGEKPYERFGTQGDAPLPRGVDSHPGTNEPVSGNDYRPEDPAHQPRW